MGLKKLVLGSALALGLTSSLAEAKGPLTCTVKIDSPEAPLYQNLKTSTVCNRDLENENLRVYYIREVDYAGKQACIIKAENGEFQFSLTDIDCDKKVDVYKGSLIGNRYVEIYREKSAKNIMNFERKFDTLYNQLRQETLAELLLEGK